MLLTIVLIGYHLQLQKNLVLRENETAMAGILGSVEADIKRAGRNTIRPTPHRRDAS